MRSNHQPADLGIIATLKIGYKAEMLYKLHYIFNAEASYEGAAKARKFIKTGCRRLVYGLKATISDAMIMLDSVWKVDRKHARKDDICHCWKKG